MITRILKRLARRIFWRHKWDYTNVEFNRRVCTVCGQVESPSDDGWHSGWDILIKGDKPRHWSAK